MNVGIPTKYSGVQFRSKLEAKYACLFDLLKISWEYEPVELRGYLPDFVVDVPFLAGDKVYSPVLIEVKPVFSPKDFRDSINTIANSGWTGAAIVAGAMIHKKELFVNQPEYIIGYGHPIVNEDHGRANSGDWFRVGWSGADGGFMIGGPTDITALWREAQNRVQWMVKK